MQADGQNAFPSFFLVIGSHCQVQDGILEYIYMYNTASQRTVWVKRDL